MSNYIQVSNIESVILTALSSYIEGRAEEIIESHVKKATEEIRAGVRDEVSKTVLNLSEMVTIKNMGKEIIITISDQRDKEKGQ